MFSQKSSTADVQLGSENASGHNFQGYLVNIYRSTSQEQYFQE